MRCNKCGRDVPNDTKFCSYCGNRVGPDWESTIPPGAVVSNAKTSNVVLLFVVLVVVAVITAGAFIAVVVARQAAEDIAHADLEITVISSASPNDYIFPPDSGNKYVQLTVNIVNNYDTSHLLSFMEFQLEVAGGARYDVTWNVEDTIPASIAAGGSATFTVAFEIPITAVPQKLVYKPLFGNEIETSVP